MSKIVLNLILRNCARTFGIQNFSIMSSWHLYRLLLFLDFKRFSLEGDFFFWSKLFSSTFRRRGKNFFQPKCLRMGKINYLDNRFSKKNQSSADVRLQSLSSAVKHAHAWRYIMLSNWRHQTCSRLTVYNAVLLKGPPQTPRDSTQRPRWRSLPLYPNLGDDVCVI